jgi:hypothetical protein
MKEKKKSLDKWLVDDEKSGKRRQLNDYERKQKVKEDIVELPFCQLIPFICKYIDRKCKGLENKFKRDRAIDYLLFIQKELDLPEMKQYSEEQIGEIIDVVVDSSKWAFNCNITKLQCVKDIVASIGKLVALMVPLVKFFR